MAPVPAVEFIDLSDFCASASACCLIALAEVLPERRQTELTKAAGLASPAEALVALALVSNLGWLVTVDGHPIAAFGCTEAGGFWLLETQAASRQLPTYLQRIRIRLTAAHSVHSVLVTEAPADDRAAQRRLRLLGFTSTESPAREDAPFPTCQYRRVA